MFVVKSQFTVRDDQAQAVKQAFRPRLVDDTPGFERMDVLSPIDAPNEIWVLTFWRDKESFDAWHTSPEFQRAHRDMPAGVKLEPGKTSMRYFEHVSD